MCSACCGVVELHAHISRLLQKNLGSSSKTKDCPLYSPSLAAVLHPFPARH